MIYIIKRYTCAVCYHSEKSATISEAVKEAYLSGANLSGADLSGADLSGAYLSGAYLSGAKIQDLATLGFPNGWSAYAYVTESGERRVQIGCQNKTFAEGRAYWANKPNRREIMAALDYAEAIANIRDWQAVPVAEAAE